MNIEALESFRVFARTLNFTRAAEQRHLTQPALHRQIKLLGESLGVELYVRRGRELKLTEGGVAVAKFSREILDRSAELQAQLHEGVAGSRVTLVAGRGSYQYLLGDAIRSFAKSFPDGLRLLTEDRPGTLAAIRGGEAHLGVTVLEELPDDLEVALLTEMLPQLVVSTRHRLAKRKSLRLKDLDGLPLICPTPPSRLRDTIAGWLGAAGLGFNPALGTSGWELMMHFASLDLGAAVVNGCCRPPRGTVAIPLKDLPPTRYYLVSHRNEYAFPALEKLRDCIARSAARVRLFGE